MVVLLAPLLVLLAVPGAAFAAPADSPILIRTLAPAAGGDPSAEWAMLQMTTDGQRHVVGETLTFYGPAGTVTASYVVSADVANGQGQRTILLGTPQAASQEGMPSPDFILNTGDALSPSAGALCVTGVFPADCVTWGSFPAVAAHALANPQSFPADAIAGEALGRVISKRGCPTWLDPADDTDNSSVEFFDGVPFTEVLGGLSPPSPRNNSAPITESPCPLNTLFNQTPAAPTNDTTPTFAFGESPSEYGVAFQCRFGAGASLSLPWSSCPPTGNTFGPLADGLFTFQAKAIGAAGEDPTPANWTFEVDTAPPNTLIDSVPPSPSAGFSATFAFHSTEPNSGFLCQYEAGPIQPCESPKTIFSLSDGPHTFRVWAVDQATNKDPSPAEAGFTVDTALGDRSAPDTQILTKPKDPSSTSTASFTYRSNEARSTFQCRLDDRPFTPCPATGISYAGLKNGEHSFSVKASDRAGNTDSIPATYAWSVKVSLPETTITSSPPGAQRIRGRARSTKISFAFKANKPGASFRCRLDKQPFMTCKSPLKLKAPVGRHRFEVYATDSLGNSEANPAKRIFRVLAPRRSGGLFQ